jgi:trigger factor
LKIETQPIDGHQVKIIAEFEPEVLDKYKQKAARRISETAKIPGFRPGKAPFAVIRRLYGDETIEHEAIDLLLDDEYQNVIKESGVNPAAPGNLEEIISNNPPKFSFTVALQPEIILGDFHSIRKPYELPLVTEDRVDAVIKNMRASYSTAEPVDRPVQEGDLVTVKLKGEFTHPAEGEDPVAIAETTPQMIVGENDFEVDDYPFVGFTRELVGMNAGDTKEIVHTITAEDPPENFRGKEIKFTVTIESVKKLTLPEINDEFAQSMGEYENLDALRKSIRQTLEENERRDYDNKYLTDLIDQIRGLSTIHYPDVVLQEEIDRVLKSLEDDLAQRKMDLPTYLKTLNQEKDAFIDAEVKPVARQRLERSLILDEIAHAEKIQLDMDALQKETEATMSALSNDPEFRKMSRGRKGQELARGVTLESANRVLNRQVLDRLKAIAKGEFETQPAEAQAEVKSEAQSGMPATESAPVENPSTEPAPNPVPEATTEHVEKRTRKKKTAAKTE